MYLSFDASSSSVSLAESPPRDLQITAYDTAAKWLRMLQIACVISAREEMGAIETNCVKMAAI